MRYHLHHLPLTLSLVILMGGCSPTSDGGNSSGGNTGAPATSETMGANASAPTIDNAAGANAAETKMLPAETRVIGLEGLGDLRVGRPIPAKGSWVQRGAQEDGSCRTVSSPDYPGVYAIVTDGKVQRITVGSQSDVKLAEGIGVGATEQDVQKWFGGFRAEPHKYEDAPAKYLTAPNAAGGSSALRFEIGQDGKVKFIHVGMMPVLAYVEGCG